MAAVRPALVNASWTVVSVLTHLAVDAHRVVLKVNPDIFLEIKTGKRTRGHDFMLVKRRSRLDVRKYAFSKRAGRKSVE